MEAWHTLFFSPLSVMLRTTHSCRMRRGLSIVQGFGWPHTKSFIANTSEKVGKRGRQRFKSVHCSWFFGSLSFIIARNSWIFVFCCHSIGYLHSFCFCSPKKVWSLLLLSKEYLDRLWWPRWLLLLRARCFLGGSFAYIFICVNHPRAVV